MGVIWIFGGTSEGRRLAEACAKNCLPVVVSVATEYGETVLEEGPYIEVMQGRMDKEQMLEYLKSRDVELVIDATHPYAVEVTGNIRQVCEMQSVNYIRLLRKSLAGREQDEGLICVDTVSEAAEYLSGTEGNIMLTTGSKELSAFCKCLKPQRLFVRVLPSVESIGICEANQIPPANRIAMQGPFSEAVNVALLEQSGCRYLVTKESGKAGGFEEKLSACKLTGAVAVVIRRPVVEDGMDFEEVCGYLGVKCGPPPIDIVGIGMGTEETMTEDVRKIIARADVLIGGARMLKRYENTGKLLFDCYQAEKIRRFIDGQLGGAGSQESIGGQSGRRIAILMSGDVGFYSGTKKLLQALQGYDVRLHPGISSVAYMAARIGAAWQDMALCSVHGRKQNVLAKIRHHETVFALAGNGGEIAEICGQLIASGMNQVEVCVGENLSYPDERVWWGSPEKCRQETFGSLCAAVFINHGYTKPPVSPGIPDEAFIRGKVPMTKEEIRTISLSKLRLTRDAVVYDIGAGTGSVSIETALAAEDGMVYAIEKNAGAADLIEENAAKFGVTNLSVIRGMAPAALENLPAPTHAFIGGSSGNLKEIIAVLQAKNPMVRIVINAISLETIAQMTELSRTQKMELIMVTVAKANPLGNYQLMMGQNPVMIGTIETEMIETGTIKHETAKGR